MLNVIAALVRKDLLLFFSDRRSVIMAFVIPIAIASFFGSIFSGQGSGEPARIPLRVVDLDNSTISHAVVAGISTDKSLRTEVVALDAAREAVRRGKATVGVVIPQGFGDSAGRAFFRNTDKPQLDFLYDPSHAPELAMVRGILTQHVMEAVSKEMFNGEAGQRTVKETLSDLDTSDMSPERKAALRELLTAVERMNRDATTSPGGSRPGGFVMPYTVREEAVTANPLQSYNGYAHSFAGMGIQFLLFAAANLGIEILLERQRGLWKRLRAAPISRATLLAGKTISMTVISLSTLWVSFAFAMIVFGVRIHGSVAGFAAVSIACAAMAAGYGLVIAAVGHTPATTRGVTMLVTLMMVMLGGAWVPTFIFPQWLQQVTVVVPVRWAVDGLDAMTWRGIGLAGAIVPTVALLAFAAAFAAVALARFRWEEA